MLWIQKCVFPILRHVVFIDFPPKVDQPLAEVLKVFEVNDKIMFIPDDVVGKRWGYF